jgi:hypothetical protein
MKDRNIRHEKKRKKSRDRQKTKKNQKKKKNQTALHLLGIEPATPATPSHTLPHLPSSISHLPPPTSHFPTHSTSTSAY